MHSCVFYVFADSVAFDYSVLGHGVNFHLLGPLKELSCNYRMLLAHHCRIPQRFFKLVTAQHHFHSCARKDVRGADKDGKAHLISEGIHILDACQFLPTRLVYPKGVAHSGELLAVLRHIDGFCRCAQDLHSVGIQLHCQVVWNLASGGYNHAHRGFQLTYVQHPFKGELVKEKPVANVIVRAYGLGVVVDHHGPVAAFLDLFYSGYAAPVKLHAAANTVCSAAKHYNGAAVTLKFYVVFGAVVSEVQIIGLGGVFTCQGVNLLDCGEDSQFLAPGTGHHSGFVQVLFCLAGNEPSYLPVREAQFLGAQKRLIIKFFQRRDILQPLHILVYVLEPEKEPLVYLGNLV